MGHFIATISFLLALLATQTVSAQQQTMRGDIFVAGDYLAGADRIAPRTEQFILYRLSDGESQLSALLSRIIEVTDENVLRVVQRYDGPNGVNIDSSTVARATLAPLTYRAEGTGSSQVFHFTPDSITGVIALPDGEEQRSAVDLDQPAYNAVVLDELIQALPLELGYAAEVLTYNPGRGSVPLTVRVVREDALTLANGSALTTWVLTLEGSPIPTTMWVDQATHQVVRLLSQLPDGSEFWKVRLYATP